MARQRYDFPLGEFCDVFRSANTVIRIINASIPSSNMAPIVIGNFTIDTG
ncbi:hypothetical protein CMUST_00085 [Corynebacterium mustelae]|uniref:Uncharacterized protein n=1 Tax=Corynebacterium mustelae TaxID=571915 RepID=A0A0G3GXW1_9CORY|nr:hypothetical protein CMUST_00085 [Corynebacterium mustelae]